jgi:hypothetical protein
LSSPAAPRGELVAALDEVSASSAGGAPFLWAYGTTFLVTAVLSFFLPRPTVALVAMFQGALALPVAIWLERRMGWQRMARDNPLKSLSAQLAMSQTLGLPALIVVYSLEPGAIPVTLASFAGMHFIAYTWLHRTRIYAVLGCTLSLVAFAMQIVLGTKAFSVILLFIGVSYQVAAPLLRRHAARLTAPATAAPGA